MAKPKKFNPVAEYIGGWRRIFARDPIKKAVLSEGRRELPKYNQDGALSKKKAVQYHCQVCNSWVPSTQIEVDHVKPLIDPEVGFIDWNTTFARLRCENDRSNLQRICESCHDKKTKTENQKRWSIEWTKELDTIEASLPTMVLEETKKALKDCKRISGKTDNPFASDQVTRATKLCTILKSRTGKAKKPEQANLF